MKCKNDLEMWHKYVEFAEHLKKTARFQEIRLINKCVYYVFDEVFEEHCRCQKIERKGDFNSKNECWKCKFYGISTNNESAVNSN